jgi:NAD-dependent SIR2 family protein deacetylase
MLQECDRVKSHVRLVHGKDSLAKYADLWLARGSQPRSSPKGEDRRRSDLIDDDFTVEEEDLDDPPPVQEALAENVDEAACGSSNEDIDKGSKNTASVLHANAAAEPPPDSPRDQSTQKAKKTADETPGPRSSKRKSVTSTRLKQNVGQHGSKKNKGKGNVSSKDGGSNENCQDSSNDTDEAVKGTTEKVGNFCRYRCKHCAVVYTSWEVFSEHMAEAHGSNKRFKAEYLSKVIHHQCNQCPKKVLCDLLFIEWHVKGCGGHSEWKDYLREFGPDTQNDCKENGEEKENREKPEGTANKPSPKKVLKASASKGASSQPRENVDKPLVEQDPVSSVEVTELAGNFCTFQCPKCKKEFSSWLEMRNHNMSSPHGSGSAGFKDVYVSKRVVHPCHICGERVLADNMFISLHLKKGIGHPKWPDYEAKWSSKEKASAPAPSKPAVNQRRKSRRMKTKRKEVVFSDDEGMFDDDIADQDFIPKRRKREKWRFLSLGSAEDPLSTEISKQKESDPTAKTKSDEAKRLESNETSNATASVEHEGEDEHAEGDVSEDDDDLEAGSVTDRAGNFCRFRCEPNICSGTFNSWRELLQHRREKHEGQNHGFKQKYLKKLVRHRCHVCSTVVLADMQMIEWHVVTHGAFSDYLKKCRRKTKAESAKVSPVKDNSNEASSTARPIKRRGDSDTIVTSAAKRPNHRGPAPMDSRYKVGPKSRTRSTTSNDVETSLPDRNEDITDFAGEDELGEGSDGFSSTSSESD